MCRGVRSRIGTLFVTLRPMQAPTSIVPASLIATLMLAPSVTVELSSRVSRSANSTHCRRNPLRPNVNPEAAGVARLVVVLAGLAGEFVVGDAEFVEFLLFEGLEFLLGPRVDVESFVVGLNRVGWALGRDGGHVVAPAWLDKG